MDTVYLETTVVGNIAGRLHPDPTIAAVHGVQFMVTWNFKHILNPHLQLRITDTCYEGGFVPPVICTPEQLAETEDDS